MTYPLSRTLAPIAALAILAGCATTPEPAPLPQSQEAFWDALSSLCGNAYAGSLASSDERDADWAGKRMVAHWAQCSDARIAIALHVEDAVQDAGWDRSRTWVVTRTDAGLRLKHDHRHADGAEDVLTQYGGDTLSAGTARVQDFPVDAYSQALFGREGLDASLTNVWRVEVEAEGTRGGRFAYQLTRRNDPTRLFRAEFDLARPVTPPPAAWGHDG